MSIANRMDAPMAGARSRILIVDDQRSNRELISDIMAEEGYEVLTAQDGLDALTRLVEPLPDVILSDLNMPRMSGFEFLAVVRKQFPHVAVIAMSGEFEGNDVPTGVLADAYLPKGGYTFEQLRSTIRELTSVPPKRSQFAEIGMAPE